MPRSEGQVVSEKDPKAVDSILEMREILPDGRVRFDSIEDYESFTVGEIEKTIDALKRIRDAVRLLLDLSDEYGKNS